MIRAHLQALPPYTPIEPFEVLSARLGRAPQEIIKLDANENPYGPLPAVRAALSNLPYAHIYPDPESRALRAALEDFTGVSRRYLLAGAGADELIDLLMRVLLDPGDTVLTCPPTFGMYAFDAGLQAARVVTVPRHPDFSLDVDAIRAAVQRERPKVLFLATPNNPDGSLPDDETLEALLALPTLVVLDEAYIEFAAPDSLGAARSYIRQVPARENLVVLRTFSKWAGLAGLRVGYGAFPQALLPVLWKAKQPYNVNVAASTAAITSLEHTQELRQVVKRLTAERERLYRALQAIPWLEIYPSQANYLLCRVRGREATAVKEALAQRGILIRYFDEPRLRDHIRISVGRPQDSKALLTALEALG